MMRCFSVICFFTLFSSQLFAEKKISFVCDGDYEYIEVYLTETDRTVQRKVKKHEVDLKVYQVAFKGLGDVEPSGKVEILMPFLDRAQADLSYDSGRLTISESESYLDGLYVKGRRRFRFLTESSRIAWMKDSKSINRLINRCDYESSELAEFFGLRILSKASAKKYLLSNVAKGDSVGFDIDDTLLFSSNNFVEATRRAAHLQVRPGGEDWWAWVNSGDKKLSKKKQVALGILEMLSKERATNTYLITARRETKPKPLRDFMKSLIPSLTEQVIFAPLSKTESITERSITFYFGDADTDIIDAQEAGATAIRILRSADSNASNSKYHPGWFGERILLGTEE